MLKAFSLVTWIPIYLGAYLTHRGLEGGDLVWKYGVAAQISIGVVAVWTRFNPSLSPFGKRVEERYRARTFNS